MRPDDVLAYLQRDRSLVEASRAEHWAAVAREHGALELLGIADELRLQVIARSPGWPSAADRAEDLAAHERLAALFDRARRPR